MRFLYNIGIYIYGLVARIIARFFSDQKAQQWVRGRKDLLPRIQNDLKNEKSPIIWFHSASLGEFEQARPLIEKLKKERAGFRILITFFSPSGFEIRKNYPLADYVYYLPEDTPSKAFKFIEFVKPKIAVFIKYEYWYNYMNQLYKKNIPLIVISSIFRPSQSFFQFYGGWFLSHLDKVSHFFVQNDVSKALLEEVGIKRVSISGDTRFDRVAQIAAQLEEDEIVRAFKNEQLLFLGGSTWPEDERLISYISETYRNLKLIIAPHQINESRIAGIEKLFPKSIRYSQAEKKGVNAYKLMIIDNIGILSSLYQYADFAMIGGGFGAGIHNTLEAATFGMPIFIGPNYQKFQEAKDLIDLDVIKIVHTQKELVKSLEYFLLDKEKREHISSRSKAYVNSRMGATQMIFDYLVQRIDQK